MSTEPNFASASKAPCYNENEEISPARVPDHHHRQGECDTRPKYRDGRRPKAVRVFTVHHESKYLLVFNVPKLNLEEEFRIFVKRFGSVESHQVTDIQGEEFSEVHMLKMASLKMAQVTKRKMDDASFYGATLHVSYAPEYETVEETDEKLIERQTRFQAGLRKVERELTAAKPMQNQPGKIKMTTVRHQNRETRTVTATAASIPTLSVITPTMTSTVTAPKVTPTEERNTNSKTTDKNKRIVFQSGKRKLTFVKEIDFKDPNPKKLKPETPKPISRPTFIPRIVAQKMN